MNPRTKPAENIRSFIDLSHIDRMTAPPAPVQPDLAFPDAPAEDVIPGPRIPLRYGSAATEIWVSKRMWRRTDRGDRFSYQGRWRSIDDYSETDCIDGKLVRVNGKSVIGVAVVDDEGFISVDKPGTDIVWTWLSPADLTVLQDHKHLNMFEQALLDNRQ
jgi:hypothetical protein